jgi:probable HAF family extracellular repeat protein
MPIVGRWVLIDLGTFGGKESEASDINDSGQIVGSADTKEKNEDGAISHGFLWHDGKLRDLGTLHSNESSYAEAINERGQVVGYSS